MVFKTIMSLMVYLKTGLQVYRLNIYTAIQDFKKS